MSHHVINFLAQSSSTVFRRDRQIHFIENAFGREPFPTNAMLTGPLKRADEIGFEDSLDVIILLLVLIRQIVVRDWSVLHLSCRC